MEKIYVAIVEDDADDREFISEAFVNNPNNMAIQIFKSGTEFLEYIETANDLPSMVITDLRMPLVSGFEVITSIKGREKTKNIPVVVFSTSENKEDVAKAGELGAAAYYVKPYSLDDYRKIVNTIMEGVNTKLSSFTSFITGFIKPLVSLYK